MPWLMSIKPRHARARKYKFLWVRYWSWQAFIESSNTWELHQSSRSQSRASAKWPCSKWDIKVDINDTKQRSIYYKPRNVWTTYQLEAHKTRMPTLDIPKLPHGDSLGFWAGAWCSHSTWDTSRCHETIVSSAKSSKNNKIGMPRESEDSFLLALYCKRGPNYYNQKVWVLNFLIILRNIFPGRDVVRILESCWVVGGESISLVYELVCKVCNYFCRRLHSWTITAPGQNQDYGLTLHGVLN